MTKQDRVINYLTKGKTLSQDSAYSMFEVGNLGQPSATSSHW